MDEFFEKDILTISEINRVAKLALEMNIPNNLCVEGEVSNITYHPSGHLYFTVKDSKSTLKAVMFSYKSKNVDRDIKHGDSLRLFGRLTIYEATGQYQFLCEYIERSSNEGDLYKKFLKLKEKLSNKGYFDESIKKPIPFATHIGVVTADQGAAIKDIISTARSRFKNINITLFPSKVQGGDAEKSIIEGIEFFNDFDVDLIIVGRGGGSYEDLNVFNSENIAEAIYRSEKPIISAVGHEVDYTIADFVADIRAATPTHAAMLATYNREDLLRDIQSKKSALNSSIQSLIEQSYSSISHYVSSINLKLSHKLESAKIRLEMLSKNYTLNNFLDSINDMRIKLINMEDRAELFFSNIFNSKRERLANLINSIKNLNPMNVLSRGYSVTSISGKLINKHLRSYKDVQVGDILDTKLKDGNIKSKVISKSKNS